MNHYPVGKWYDLDKRTVTYQVPVVRRLVNAIQWISVNKTNHAMHCIATYPVDSVIHPLTTRVRGPFLEAPGNYRAR